VAELLELDGIGCDFGGVSALSDIHMGLETGELVGVIGPNGAGKSTLFGIIAGAIRPTRGTLAFAGHNVTGWGPEAATRAGVARTFQTVRVFASMSVLENVMVAAHLHERSRQGAQAASLGILTRVGLGDIAYRDAVSLTLASRKRLEVARALATRPTILLLDEMMSGLTPQETAEAVELVRGIQAGGVTILLVEHVMEVIMPLCSRVVVLDHGVKIAEGSPATIVRDPAVVAAYLGSGDEL